MKIAICEDNNEQRLTLENAVSAAVSKEQIHAEIISFSSEGEFEEYLSQNEAPKISFLDIYLDANSAAAGGVKLARTIKEKDSGAAIIFVTSSSGHMPEAWDIGAVHYLIKPITMENTEQALSRAIRLVGADERFIELLVNRRQRKIRISDILYVESFNKYCNVHTKNGEVLKAYMRLDDIEAMLPEQFLRCYISYIVNMDAIESVNEEHNSFVLPGGVYVPIRVKNKASIITQYEAYCFSELRRDL